MTLDLAEIRARAEAAPAWPTQTVTNRGGRQQLDTAAWTTDEWNAMQPFTIEFMAHAREDVLALVADVELGQRILASVNVWLDQNEGDISLPAFKALGAILDEIKP